MAQSSHTPPGSISVHHMQSLSHYRCTAALKLSITSAMDGDQTNRPRTLLVLVNTVTHHGCSFDGESLTELTDHNLKGPK
jgi:hypothetical protein